MYVLLLWHGGESDRAWNIHCPQPWDAKVSTTTNILCKRALPVPVPISTTFYNQVSFADSESPHLRASYLDIGLERRQEQLIAQGKRAHVMAALRLSAVGNPRTGQISVSSEA